MTFEIRKVDEEIRGAYGMTTADMNGDGLRDIVAGSTAIPMIAWYETPTFRKHVVSTAHKGTITLAAHDLRATGRPDLIAGSGFNRRDRSTVEYLHWLERPSGGGEWKSHRIEEIPYLHRMSLMDVFGDGDPVLIVASLRGPEGGFDEWHDPGGVWVYPIPEDPYGPWPKTAIDDRLRLNHGLAVCDVDDDGRPDLMVGSRDGLIWYEPPAEDLTDPWERWVVSERESSECWAADLDGDGVNEVLSIEPWHGNELCVYRCLGDIRRGPWERTLIDAGLNRGHSVQAADVDGDGLPELLVGFNGEGTSLLLYRQDGRGGWQRETIDDGLGMGQMEVWDLDGDGRIEVAATGMSTGNVRYYKGNSERREGRSEEEGLQKQERDVKSEK